jgi:hypothetical protein
LLGRISIGDDPGENRYFYPWRTGKLILKLFHGYHLADELVVP